MGLVLSELKTEIETDPQSIGYAGKTNAQIAELLNDPVNGSTIDVENLSRDQLQMAVVASEWTALSSAVVGVGDLAVAMNKQQLWLSLLSMELIPVKDTEIRNQVAAIWGSGTTTRANLLALQTKQGSRAEVLWGDGIVITLENIRNALDLP